MSQIIKAFLGVFLLLLLATCGIAIFSAFLSVIQAQNLHAEIVNQLESSAFHPSVLEECFEAADEEGYELTVLLYEEGKYPYDISSVDEVPASTEDVDMARVSLDFPLKLPFFLVGETHRLTAYAY